MTKDGSRKEERPKEYFYRSSLVEKTRTQWRLTGVSVLEGPDASD